MATQVKLRIEPDQEIRRFNLEANATFELLRQRVEGLVGHANFRIEWKDPEGDMVVLSSADELAVAKEVLNNDLLRLFVRPTKTAAAGGEKEVHRGATCDGVIAGDRFKCSLGPDFDLCEGCHGKGTHPEHDMLVIRALRSSETELASGTATPQEQKQPEQPQTEEEKAEQQKGTNAVASVVNAVAEAVTVLSDVVTEFVEELTAKAESENGWTHLEAENVEGDQQKPPAEKESQDEQTAKDQKDDPNHLGNFKTGDKNYSLDNELSEWMEANYEAKDGGKKGYTTQVTSLCLHFRRFLESKGFAQPDKEVLEKNLDIMLQDRFHIKRSTINGSGVSVYYGIALKKTGETDFIKLTGEDVSFIQRAYTKPVRRGKTAQKTSGAPVPATTTTSNSESTGQSFSVLTVVTVSNEM
ncbi:hypothetical protein BV898_12315 [Hypsibius exemplaris]|uniref:PB1 domain-containing protein n=1 Tax=Hypsibius exemplaris TaxID=2072580 RepID=A0A1W0WEB6_HYPEX|nr:hypothetical protein BV898_12315 [Hypsibius exemplaris]